MKEREMERSEVTRAAAQADEAEHQLALLQRRFNDEKEEFKTKMAELESLLVVAESVRSSQTAQIDDLQFRLEEESILRADSEVCKFVFQNIFGSPYLKFFFVSYHSGLDRKDCTIKRRNGLAKSNSLKKRRNVVSKRRNWPHATKTSWMHWLPKVNNKSHHPPPETISQTSVSAN